MKETISIKLIKTLQKGKEQLGKEALKRIIDFVESQRTEEESFIDKSGKADLYYTLFGWTLSYILEVKLDKRKTSNFLIKQNIEALDLIHYAAYMRCRMVCQLQKKGKMGVFFTSFLPRKIRELEEFDGLPHNDMQSPYTLFIWLSLLEDMKCKIKDKKSILDSLAKYRLPNGGYMNMQAGLSATTNATVATLSIIGQLNGYIHNPDVVYLQDLQESSGGFGATKASPVPDLLSTATALFMLKCYGMQHKYPVKNFIEAHWLESGGFSATLLEEKSDIEYTFYGLLALGACNN